MDNFFYHYTTVEKFLNGICKTNSIRFNSILKVNDPLDSKMRYYESNNFFHDNIEKGIEYQSKKDEFKKIIQEKWINNCKVLCFSVNNIDDTIKGFQLANLWTYYSNNHSGLCLKFYKDKTLDLFNDTFKIHYPLEGAVDYKDIIDKANFSLDYMDNLFVGVEQNKASLFFQKLQVWDREQEYRLICFSKNEYEYIPLDGLICEIILGQKSSKETELLVKNKFANINLSKMNYFIGQGGFDKVDINDSLWKEQSRI